MKKTQIYQSPLIHVGRFLLSEQISCDVENSTTRISKYDKKSLSTSVCPPKLNRQYSHTHHYQLCEWPLKCDYEFVDNTGLYLDFRLMR